MRSNATARLQQASGWQFCRRRQRRQREAVPASSGHLAVGFAALMEHSLRPPLGHLPSFLPQGTPLLWLLLTEGPTVRALHMFGGEPAALSPLLAQTLEDEYLELEPAQVGAAHRNRVA